MSYEQYKKTKDNYLNLIGGESCPAKDYANVECPKTNKEYKNLLLKIHPDKNYDCKELSTELTKRINKCDIKNIQNYKRYINH